MSQIVSLNSNQSVFATSSLVNFSLESNKELPRWLLEFDSFTAREDNCKSEGKQARPLTESHLHNRPKWFEELSQRRRLSDIPIMEMDEKEQLNSTAIATEPINLFEDTNLKHAKTSHSPDMVEQQLQQENKLPKLPTEQKLSNDWMFLANGGDSLGQWTNHHSRNSSSGGSKNSFLTDVNLLCQENDDDILSFSTSRSIEKLRISEVPVAGSVIEECIIPEMPRGSELTLSIFDNWGDDNFIGINGIEILDSLGKRPLVKNIYLQDSANKRHQQEDLRKLVDSVYRTHDDAHIWQYRVRREQLPLQIVFQLQEPVTIALLRIWNYNKSRIHSYRGVKYLQIKLGSQLIFSGEVAKASGELNGSVENFGDTILFTTNETILEHISHYDTSFQELLMEQFQQVPLKF